MRALYISQNGMAENLGQSQVLPYLRGLVRRGVEIDLVSFELATLSAEAREEIREGLAEDGITWHSLVRTMGTSLPVKIAEASKGVGLALRTAFVRKPDIVHGRSYFATAICDAIARTPHRGLSRGPKLLFDCRGMIGDEYVDCGHWTTDRLEYRLVKAYERRLFAKSDGIVVLTHALERWLRDHRALGERPLVQVIPCCVDLEKFRPSSDDERAKLRRELGLADDAFAMIYSGSLGTWYLEPEMARYAKAIRDNIKQLSPKRRVAFVCFTPSDATSLTNHLTASGFPSADIIVRRVPPKEMPKYLSLGDIGLSFIQSCFSKKGSSPTKVAEYLACGNVAVVNGDIGDQADLAAERASCVVLDDFSDASIKRAAAEAIALAATARASGVTVETARRHFGLEEVGVERYAALYAALAV